MRALLFVIWLQASKTAAATLALIETLATSQYEVVQSGGARIIRSSVAGKSFDFELPKDWAYQDLPEALREAWSTIKKGGASGGQMTDAELEAYLIDESDEVSDAFRAVVSYGNTRGI